MLVNHFWWITVLLVSMRLRFLLKCALLIGISDLLLKLSFCQWVLARLVKASCCFWSLKKLVLLDSLRNVCLRMALWQKRLRAILKNLLVLSGQLQIAASCWHLNGCCESVWLYWREIAPVLDQLMVIVVILLPLEVWIGCETSRS